ncbi:MAG: hypothetical protein C0409_01380 [Novosphingobium sp.]|nr:hypothetical protein [Novosphingobium sp.]
MIVRAGTGWQYALADLSLILFLVTASALAQASSARRPPLPVPPSSAPASAPAPTPAPPVVAAFASEPVAVWSAGNGAPPLAAWLARVGADPRLEVQIVVRYTDSNRQAAAAQAVGLAVAGGRRASAARILVEPGARAGASVSLSYASEALTAPPEAGVALAR